MAEKQELTLSKEEFGEFRKLIDNIELRDVITVKQAFEANRKHQVAKAVEVTIESAPAKITVETDLNVLKSYRVLVKQGKKGILIFSATYEILFTARNAEKVNAILENEKIRQLFEGLQLSKILWPFIREEFRTASSKAGMKPFTLPFLK
jgi:preprotein translocase subunit SecB